MRVCSTPGCPTLIPTSGRCPVHARAHDQARGSRQSRGYDAKHDRLRREWAPLVADGTIQCARCDRYINTGEPWALDHNDDRTSYLGPSHTRCNNSAGGKAAHR